MYNLKWMYQTSLAVFIVVVVVMSFQCFKSPSRASENDSSLSFTKLSKQLEDRDYVPLHWWKKSTKSTNSAVIKTKGDSKREFPLSLPFPRTTLSTNKLLQQQWVSKLKEILSEISPESPPVHTIAGNYEYREVLLNWLISAKVRVNPPLTNIIAVSIDSPLCQLLNKRNITCLYVHWKDFLVKELESPLAVILVLRLTIIRLLNYWGYDAANIDTDALILKNPEPLYQEFMNSDMVAGRGAFPAPLHAKWGDTACAGSFMIRSTPNTEKYWTAMSAIKTNKISFEKMKKKIVYDDQARLNYALQSLHPVWKNTTRQRTLDPLKRATTASGFTATLLLDSIICRKKCKKQLQSKYYMWHPHSGDHQDMKAKYADTADLWFLQPDWESVVTTSTGEQWLREISNLS